MSHTSQLVLQALCAAYADLWRQQQGMIAAISARLGVSREILEREAQTWLASQSENLPPEGQTRLLGILLAAGFPEDVLRRSGPTSP